MIHGNLNRAAIYVNKAGDWKLGGLDLVSAVNDASSALRVI